MSNTEKFALANRVDLLREVYAALKQERTYYLKTRDWRKVRDRTERLKAAKDRLENLQAQMPFA
jgi:hypothetical protein